MISLTDFVVSGGLLGVLTFVWKAANEQNKKISRIYQRFDEYKEHFETKYVARDMCAILHKQIKDDIAEIKIDVKELLKR